MKSLTLGEFAAQAEELDEAVITVRATGVGAAKAVENLRRLRRLELLTDEAVLSLIGQAPIDPLGIFALLQPLGAWAFSAHDFCVVRVLSQKNGKPVALMRVDLLSDDIVFVVLREGKLVERLAVSGESLAELAKRHDPASMLRSIEKAAQDTIAEGEANA